jgi:hypothetical protein
MPLVVRSVDLELKPVTWHSYVKKMVGLDLTFEQRNLIMITALMENLECQRKLI